MTKVVIYKDLEGDVCYGVVAPNGVKPFGKDKRSAIYVARLSASKQLVYAGPQTESRFFNCAGNKKLGQFFVEEKR